MRCDLAVKVLFLFSSSILLAYSFENTSSLVTTFSSFSNNVTNNSNTQSIQEHRQLVEAQEKYLRARNDKVNISRKLLQINHEYTILKTQASEAENKTSNARDKLWKEKIEGNSTDKLNKAFNEYTRALNHSSFLKKSLKESSKQLNQLTLEFYLATNDYFHAAYVRHMEEIYLLQVELEIIQTRKHFKSMQLGDVIAKIDLIYFLTTNRDSQFIEEADNVTEHRSSQTNQMRVTPMEDKVERYANVSNQTKSEELMLIREYDDAVRALILSEEEEAESIDCISKLKEILRPHEEYFDLIDHFMDIQRFLLNSQERLEACYDELTQARQRINASSWRMNKGFSYASAADSSALIQKEELLALNLFSSRESECAFIVNSIKRQKRYDDSANKRREHAIIRMEEALKSGRPCRKTYKWYGTNERDI